jgi:hypothetical protein
MFSVSDRAKIITTMWAIWLSRNSWTHDHGSYDPVQSLKMAKDTLAVLEIPKKDVTILPGHGWRPPDVDIVKINIDGGMSLEARQGGAGGVARTHTTFLGAWSKPYHGVTDSLITEALALRDGVLCFSFTWIPEGSNGDRLPGGCEPLEHSLRLSFSRGTDLVGTRRAIY